VTCTCVESVFLAAHKFGLEMGYASGGICFENDLITIVSLANFFQMCEFGHRELIKMQFWGTGLSAKWQMQP